MVFVNRAHDRRYYAGAARAGINFGAIGAAISTPQRLPRARPFRQGGD
jgi:hypothetical protein